MKTTRFTTFTYDVVDELSLGQIEKVAELSLDVDPNTVRIPSSTEMQDLEERQVALQLYHPQTGLVKKYACYEPGLTQLNAQLLLEKSAHLPDEIVKKASAFLARAARNQGLDNDLVQALQAASGGTKYASNIVDVSSIDETAYVRKLEAERSKEASVSSWALPHKKRYPLDTVEDIEKAAEYFGRHYKQFDPDDRLVFAMNTCGSAKVAGVPLVGTIAKYARLDTQSFNPEFARHVSMRKAFVKEAEDFVVYEELIEKSASLGVVKSARVLEAIDNAYGLNTIWGTRLADPVISTCSMEKEAELEIDGRYVTRTDLDSLLKKDISGWVDSDTRNELAGEDGLDVLRSLPEPTRDGLLAELE